MMKKVIWLIIVLAIAGYFFHSHLVNRAEREARRAEAKRMELSIKSKVSEMASRTNAVCGWEQQLCNGESYRLEPILTVELERLWLKNRPILFVGIINDIATYNDSYYTVLIEWSDISSFDFMFDTELQLSLLAPKGRIDSFLNKHPNFIRDDRFENGVAVIANIRAIKTSYILGEEGDRIEIKIGEGEMIDILYTGDVQF